MKGRFRFPTLWVLIFLGALSVCIQYVTMTKFWVLPPSKSYITWGAFLRAIQEEPITFGPLDALLAVLFLLCTALLLYEEARHRVLTEFLQDCFDSPRKTFWLLTGTLIVCGRFYFARGELSWAADASHHLAHSWIAAQAIADGQVPIWTFFIGTGSPVFQTYGFAFFYLVGLVDLVLDDFYLSLKLIMGAAHVLSGIGMYLLAASLCRSRSAGFIAGLAYALCFWHTQHVLFMGRLPLSLFYALLPWTFLWIEQVVDSPRRMRAALLGGASLALLAFTHPGYGAFAMGLAGCYGLVRLWSCWGCPERAAVLRAGLLLFALGIVLGSYMNVGMYFERAHTRMHDFAMNLSGLPDPTWLHLLGWSNYRFWLIPPEPIHWYGGYLGISLCVIAITGGLAVLRRKDRRLAACWLCLLLTLLVVCAYRLPSINSLPLIHAFNASRYLLFLTFFLSLAVGIGAHVLTTNAPWGIGRSRWCSLLLLAVFADLFPTTFLQPYYSPEKTPTGWPSEIFAQVTEEAKPFEEQGELPNYRAQWIAEGIYPALRRARMLYIGRTPIAETFHPGELRTLDTFTGPFTDWAHRVLSQIDSVEQLKAHPDLFSLIAGFQLLNTHRVLATSNERRSVFSFRVEDRPILVSGRLAGYEEDVDLAGITARFGEDLNDRVAHALWIITRTGLHEGSGLSCQRILVRGLKDELDLGTKPTAQVLAHRVDHQQVEMKVTVSEEVSCATGLRVLALSAASPLMGHQCCRWRRPAASWRYHLNAGEHDILITARLSPLRKGLLLLAGICLSCRCPGSGGSGSVEKNP